MITIGFCVTQVHLIFHPIWLYPIANLPSYFLYAQHFNIIPQNTSTPNMPRGNYPDQVTGMYVMKHALRSDAGQTQIGDVVPLESVHLPIHLTPCFGQVADPHLTAETSLIRKNLKC